MVYHFISTVNSQLKNTKIEFIINHKRKLLSFVFVFIFFYSSSAFSVPLWQCQELDYKLQYPLKDPNDGLLTINSKLSSGVGIASIAMRYHGINYPEFLTSIANSDFKKKFNSLVVNQKITTLIRKDDCNFVELNIPLPGAKQLKMFREDNKLLTKLYVQPKQYREEYRTFIIKDSLFYDGEKVGVPDKVLSDIELIFTGHLDFSVSIRKGDVFRVLYETVYLNDNFSYYGRVLAVQYLQKSGKLWSVLDYITPDLKHYYLNNQADNMATYFIRNPVKYSRISSRYSLTRKHPILNIIKAHKGIDFAAPRGTPIRATAAGVIIKRTFSKSYGNFIIIKHGSRYTTVYGHLSKFAKIKKNSKVKRGQLIGYVGSTGLATGPHLHYEFRVHGKHMDPMSVKLPTKSILPDKDLVDFQYQKTKIWDRFEFKKNEYEKSQNNKIATNSN